MPRVTQKLKDTWTMQLAQILEEREITQSGQTRSAADIEIVDFDVELHHRLLALPIGTKFDAQQVQRDMLAEREA